MSSRRALAIRPAPALLEALGQCLPAGAEYQASQGNVDALRIIRSRAIDVVVTDPQTAFSEDLALAAALRELRPGLRVIVLAPTASQAELVEAMRSHVYGCFTDPIDYREVADMVRAALGQVAWRDGIEVISGSPHWVTCRVSCHLLTAERLVRFLTEYQTALPDDDRDLLITAFREMLLNAMEHGAGFDPEKTIEVTAARTARAIVFHLRDPGVGFDTGRLEHAAASSSHAAVLASTTRREEIGVRPGGFGMLIVRQIVDEIIYNERGNEVILIKHLD